MPASLLPRRHGKTLLGEDRHGNIWKSHSGTTDGLDWRHLQQPSSVCSTLPRHAVGCHREHVRHRRGSGIRCSRVGLRLWAAPSSTVKTGAEPYTRSQSQEDSKETSTKKHRNWEFLNLRTAKVASLELIGEPCLDDPGKREVELEPVRTCFHLSTHPA